VQTTAPPPIAGSGRAFRIPTALAFAAILALGKAVYFHRLASTSLWNDEGFSYLVAAGGVRDMLTWLEADTHPPLYYLALVGWLDLGRDVFTLRSLSAAASIVALAFTYFSAREVLGRGAALLAMALFALSPHVLMWAQKARPYALQTMLVAIALWGFLRVIEAPAARTQAVGAGILAALRTRRAAPASIDLAWVAYILGGGLAMLTQHPAGFFVLGCNCAMLLVLARGSPGRLLVNWVIAQLVLAAIWLAWLPRFLAQLALHLTPGQIARKHAGFIITNADLGGKLMDLLSVAGLWRPQRYIFAVYMLLLLFGLWTAWRRRDRCLPVYAVVLTPVLACVAGHFLVHPVFGYVLFTFNWLLVPYAIVIAHAVTAIPLPVLRLPVLAVLLAGNVWGLKNGYEYTPPPIAEAAAIVAAGAQPGDGIVFSEHHAARYGMAYYLRDLPIRIAGLDASRDGTALIHTEAAADGNRRNWVVLPAGELPAVEFGGAWHVAEEHPLFQMAVRRYDRAP
jgi:uncharacterized membrane protein